MHRFPKGVAIFVALAGLLLFGYPVYRWIFEKQSFSLRGDWWPVIMGVAGIVIAGLGTMGFIVYGEMKKDVRHRHAITMIFRRFGWDTLGAILWLAQWGSLAAAVGLVISAFSVGREHRQTFGMFVGLAIVATGVHFALDWLRNSDERKERKAEAQRQLEAVLAEDKEWRTGEALIDPTMLKNLDESEP